MGADISDLDRETWPEAEIQRMSWAAQWWVVDRLDRLGLVDYRGHTTEARLRLWRRGRWGGGAPTFVYCPRWVNAVLLSEDEGDPARLLTEENVAAAEAVSRLAPSGIDYMIALRLMLTGEPSPLEGGWQRREP